MKLSRTLTLVCMVAFAVMVFSLPAAAFEPTPVTNKVEAAKAVKSIPSVQFSTNDAVKAAFISNYNLTLSSGVQPEYLAIGPLANKEVPKTDNSIGRFSPAHGPPIDRTAVGNSTEREFERHERPDPIPLC